MKLRVDAFNFEMQNFPSQKKKLTFKGKPVLANYIQISNASDAIKCWENMKYAKFYDVHSDKQFPGYKEIRKENYKYLDKLTKTTDKAQFVEQFCKITSFPYLVNTSNNIINYFEKFLKQAQDYLNKNSTPNNCYSNAYDVLDYGYDHTSSLGLKKSFPGTDLDKGYIILRGYRNYNDNKNEEDKTIVNNFKKYLWENLDQRFVSLNNPDTFPAVYTHSQTDAILQDLEPYVDKVISGHKSIDFDGIPNIFKGFLVPFVFVDVVQSVGRQSKFEDNKKNNGVLDPYLAAEFNLKLAKQLPDDKMRELAKNFAFFAETVAANPKEELIPNGYPRYTIINNSFTRCSNVTQIDAWKAKIANGYMKSKLRHREILQRDFFKMDSDQKYELIKDVIKASSSDQCNPKFSKFFVNDDDISQRYACLLRSLK